MHSHTVKRLHLVHISTVTFMTTDFYDAKENPYGVCSNYATGYPIVVDEVKYATSEHAYQEAKFADEWYREKIRTAKTPNMARELAQCKDQPTHRWAWRRELNKTIQEAIKRGVTIREDWDKVKDQVMLKIVTAKFTQHKRLRAILISTRETIIRECSPRDSYWGTGKDGKGRNQLGITLMQVRQLIKDEQKQEN
jgi:predicted NAD-dependent protein-ADP-ribosyltransferase YbiA (DUF1768 family)